MLNACLPILSTGWTGTKNPGFSTAVVVVVSSPSVISWLGLVLFLFLLMLSDMKTISQLQVGNTAMSSLHRVHRAPGHNTTNV